MGTGASSEVWRGALVEPFGQLRPGTEIVLKRLRREERSNPAAIAALAVEAEVGRAVSDPGIADLLHAGRGDDGPFLILRYVSGQTLEAVLQGVGMLPEPRVRAVGIDIARALAALHAAGWIHGDLKPANVRLAEEGHAVVVDLGLARRSGDESDASTAGSLAYLAPERIRGEAPGPAVDLFALGVVLYELATGRHPFLRHDAESDAGALLARLDVGPRKAPSEHVPRLTPFFDRLTHRLLSPRADERPGAAELATILAEGERGGWWRAEHSEAAVRSIPGEAARYGTPFVSREAALGELQGCYEQSIASTRGRAAWLTGEPGSGKTRLVAELVRQLRVAERPPIYLYARSSGLDTEGRPGQPIRALLQHWLGLDDESAPGARERELLEALVPQAVADTLVCTLDPLFEGSTALPVPVALTDWLQALARRDRLIVMVDDLGRAEAGTMDILGRLTETTDVAGLLLVLGPGESVPDGDRGALDGLRQRLESSFSLCTVHLEPLDESAILQLVEGLFHPTAPLLSIAQALHRRTHGNARLITDVVDTARRRGEARPFSDEDSRLALTIAPDALPMPSTVGKFIAQRFRELPAAERHWLQRFSVVGGRLETEFLARTFAPAPRAELESVLTSLVQSGWLVSVGARYRFTRPAQRELVYRSIRKPRRTRLHALAADALAPRGDERPTLASAFQRAFHLRQAGSHEALLATVQRLVATMAERGHPRRVETLARWGLDALEALPPSPTHARLRVDLLEAAADAADKLSFRTKQREFLDRLADLELDPERDVVTLGRIYLLHGRFAMGTGRYGLARGMFHNAATILRKAGELDMASDALRRLAQLQTHIGELDNAEKLALEARGLGQSDAQRARARLVLTELDLLRDYPERALKRLRLCLQELGEAGQRASDRGTLAMVYLQRARAYRLLGRPRRARAAIARAARLAHQAGERRLEVDIGAWMGRMLLDMHSEREAELRLREALRLAREIEYPRGRALASVLLGTLLAEADDPEGAVLLSEAVALASELGLHRFEALGLAILARIARQRGDLEQARESAYRASELLERYASDFADRIVITATEALIRASSGDPQGARRLERGLRRRVHRENESIEAPVLRQRHRRFSTRLLDAALSPDGPVYPRIRLSDVPARPD